MLEKITNKIIFSKSEIKIIISLFSLLLIGIVAKHFINIDDDSIPFYNNSSLDSAFINADKNNEMTKSTISLTDTSNVKININTAEDFELEVLPGIGSNLAKDIVSYRIKNGKFDSIYDLMSIKGIGAKKFEKIKNLITI